MAGGVTAGSIRAVRVEVALVVVAGLY